MKYFAKLAVLGAALVAVAPCALATPITGDISISGAGTTITATSITFAQPVGGVVLAATGSLGLETAFPAGVSLANLSGLSMLTPNVANGLFFSTPVASCTSGVPLAPCVTFSITGLTTVNYTTSSTSPSSTYPTLTVDGTGIFTETGYANTAGTFALVATANGLQSFTLDTPVATPEPSSLVLLGSGLVSAGGMLLRRRKVTA